MDKSLGRSRIAILQLYSDQKSSGAEIFCHERNSPLQQTRPELEPCTQKSDAEPHRLVEHMLTRLRLALVGTLATVATALVLVLLALRGGQGGVLALGTLVLCIAGGSAVCLLQVIASAIHGEKDPRGESMTDAATGVGNLRFLKQRLEDIEQHAR